MVATGPCQDSRVPQYYLDSQHRDRRHHLVKALHEVARRIANLAQNMDPHTLDSRASDDEWTVAQIIGFLRDSEREDQASLEAMVRIDGAKIEDRRAIHGPQERRYRADDVADLLWDFLMLRQDTEWILQSAGTAWRNVGMHPYRGEVELEQFVLEMSERDLDAMWRIQRARDEHRPRGAPPVTGAADIPSSGGGRRRRDGSGGGWHDAFDL